MTSTSSTPDRGRWRAIILAGITLTAPLLWLHDDQVEHHQSLCPFKAFTGFPCPGCGITRSLVFLYRGDVVRSLHYHLFGPALVLFCIAVIVVALVELRTHKAYFRRVLYSSGIAWSLGVLLAAYHVVRLVSFVRSHSMDDILRESIWK